MTVPHNTDLLTPQVRELLDWILRQLDFPGSDEILQQVAHMTVVGGPITMLDLRITEPSPASAFADGPAPMSATVTDTAGEAVGELLVWLKDGYLDGLEFAWWTDEAPNRLPVPEQIRVTRR